MTIANEGPIFSDKITLVKSVKRGDDEITVVQIRKPQPGELRGLSLNNLLSADVDAHLKLLPRITQPPIMEAELTTLDSGDFSDLVNETVVFLLPNSQRASLLARSKT